MSFEPRVAKPQGGASLMLAFQSKNKNVIVIGENTIAANRVLSCLEADATVYLVADPNLMCPELEYRVQHQQAIFLAHTYTPSLLDLHRFDLGFICSVPSNIDDMVSQFKAHAIPINVTDRSDLCDFFMTSTYRDQSLQVAVSTNGQASKLSNRIRRHITSSLPPHLGEAIERVGILRKKVRASDPGSESSIRRMTWLAQICEYWSMERLAQLSERDMEELLDVYHHDEGYESTEPTKDTVTPTIRHSDKKLGTLTLVGAGTGDPELLTLAAHRAIQEADLVLADKIVPEQVIALVHCELKIARKFPGNADAAQQEFNTIALKAIQQGKNVVRLKQGDPYLFGRGGEEVLFFRPHHIVPRVIPGISSTVAATLLAGIPLTHRGVASQFLVTTGTGMKNSSAPLPTFDSSRTDVFLMSIHRLESLVQDLVATQKYPGDTPCAIIERASCKDQRVIYGTLERIVQLLESCGGSRPPGLLVVGRAIDVLKHENKGKEGVAANLMTASGLSIDFAYGEEKMMVLEEKKKNLLELHDPQCVF